MLSTVLNSEQAIEVNIAIMRTFVRLRQMLETNEELNRKFTAVIRKPKLGVLLMAGLACLVVGLLLKKKRAREAHLEQAVIDSLSPKLGAAKDFLYSGPRDHLMYIPLQYWSIAYFAGAIIYLMLSGSAPERP